MKKAILAVSMLSLAFISCKKDDKEEAVTPTKENLVGSYKVTSITAAGINVFNNQDESSNYFEACERDDVYTLKADLTAERADAGIQCDPVNNGTGTWDLVNGNVIALEEVFTTMDIEGTIKSWNGSKLVLEDNSMGFIVSVTLQKQ